MEDCLKIDVAFLCQNRVFKKQGIEFTHNYKMGWLGDDITFNYYYDRDIKARPRLQYKCHAEGVTSVGNVLLDTTVPNYGGRRFWLVCGHRTGHGRCGRRCRVLYRPFESSFFACRECHGLTYWLRQIHRTPFEVIHRAKKKEESLLRQLREARSLDEVEAIKNELSLLVSYAGAGMKKLEDKLHRIALKEKKPCKGYPRENIINHYLKGESI